MSDSDQVDTEQGIQFDVISIFPEYLAPLQLSLIGKAIRDDVINLNVHDLRDWTTDRHQTVDDTPYGGGAGMVMMAEPWAQAVDDISQDQRDPVLIIPTPAAPLFDQSIAQELSGKKQLIFACGRYEGIDQRFFDYASDRLQVRPLSLGDYVLNGGEVAALAMIEAISRLIPGVVGNPESLIEESHGANGLLEYPVYTKPAQWRGREVPEILLSGDHAKIAAWRQDQSVQRTRSVRPELIQNTADSIIIRGD